MRYQYQIITAGAGIDIWKQGVFWKNAKFLKIIEIFKKHGFCGVVGCGPSASMVLISVPRSFRNASSFQWQKNKMIRLRDLGDTAPNLTYANSKLWKFAIIGLIWLILSRIIAHRFSSVSFCLVVGFWSVAPQNVRHAIPLRFSCVGPEANNQTLKNLQKTLSRLMIVSLIHLIENFETAVTFSVVDRFWIWVAHDNRRGTLFRFQVRDIVNTLLVFEKSAKNNFCDQIDHHKIVYPL